MSDQAERWGVSRRGFLGGVAAGVAGGVASTALGSGALAQPGAALPAAPGASGLISGMETDQQWAGFLARQDLIWERAPKYWFESAFLGNGLLGVMVYQAPGSKSLRIDIGHSEVQDHRPEFGSTWGLARLLIGHLDLNPVGTITDVDLRLSLWDAELRGTVTTTAGRFYLRAIVHNDRSVLVVHVTATKGERGYTWSFHPEEAISPRWKFQPMPAGYTGNGPWVTSTEGDVHVVEQPLLAGGGHATAYRDVTDPSQPGARTLVLNVAHSFPESKAKAAAVDAVLDASGVPLGTLQETHRAWWHAFYKRSFLSVPDQRLESFYWIQLYKVAAATREKAPVMATAGPWIQSTPWPAVWWNLNVQLEYWLILGSNHLELDAVTYSLDKNRQQLIDCVPEPYRHDSMAVPRTTDRDTDGGLGVVGVPGQASPNPELGNLTWALHNVWLTYRHTMDDDLLRNVLFPLLRRAMNYYLHFLTPGSDGKLHLGPTFSPEYGVLAPDCNYDLALIRWACRTLIDSAKRLGVDDPLAPKWAQVLQTLVAYPIDENGYMIGAGVPFAKSHRHYSHLMMIYPLYEVTGEQPQNIPLIDKSLKHWIGFEGALQGYSFTGAASISAQLRRGNDAAGYLGELLRRFIKPNTMYQESGPVIETPLSAAQSLHDMLVQSWGNVIRIFPAVPDSWADATVHNFRTEGAFLISAARRGGVTRFVRVQSLAGQPCRIRHGIAGRIVVQAKAGTPVWRQVGDMEIEIDLRAGEEVVIYRVASNPALRVGPVPISAPGAAWGLQALPPVGETVPLDLSSHLNNDGVSSSENRTDGDFDGAGLTYPVEDLPAGGAVVYDKVTFTFPSMADGKPNNVKAAGQTIAVPAGRYAKLRVLGAGAGGNVTAAATANYADGTTGAVTIRLSNWTGAPFYDEAEILRTRRRHGPPPTNGDAANAAIFHQFAALDPAKELTSITLPNSSRLHLFALSLEKSPA